jgi:hypothetical protein
MVQPRLNSKIYPSHGPSGGQSFIEHTRAYLRDFADASNTGDAKTVEKRMLGTYSEHHAKTVLTLPAYFPDKLS